MSEAILRPGTEFSPVTDLGLSPEALADENLMFVLDSVQEVWGETDGMDAAQIDTHHDWLINISLRASGSQSSQVRERGLRQFEDDTEEAAAFSSALAKFGGSEQSHQFRTDAPQVANEFNFKAKFSGQEPNYNNLKFVVFPIKDSGIPIKGSGAWAETTEGEHGIFINAGSFENAFVNNSHGSRGFIAHELAHSMRQFTIGEGQPLGHLINELYAEWVGDDKGGYYAEKHFANLLAATGLNIRGDLLPGMASGEIGLKDAMQSMKQYFGTKNMLRLMAYAPENYGLETTDSISSIVEDCMAYAVKSGMTTDDEITWRLRHQYDPHKADIMLTNTNIRPLLPSRVRYVLGARAAEGGGKA